MADRVLRLMTTRKLQIVIFGLTITSSWGNGHATTYRSLVRGLALRGHSILFLERDKPWYEAHRDLPEPPFGQTMLYQDVTSLFRKWGRTIASADLVIVGSYVPDGAEIGRMVLEVAKGVTAFYDIDTPVTLVALAAGTCGYLSEDQVSKFHLYLSFTGGPTLQELEERWGARRALPLYCAADPDMYRPQPAVLHKWDLGYLGTFSPDRQIKTDRLICEPASEWSAGRFVVAGPSYPAYLNWPANVERIEHLSPDAHPTFYAAQRFTLNITRADMVRRGWSPSVRLFEAACCGTPILSDGWDGLDMFFRPGKEILLVRDADDVLDALTTIPEHHRLEIATAARDRVLASHTSDHRALELEGYAFQALRALHECAEP